MSENALNLTVKESHHADLRNGGPGFVDPKSRRVANAHGMRTAFKDFAIEEAHVEGHVLKLAMSRFDTSSARTAFKRGQLLPKRRKLMVNFENCVYTGKNLAGDSLQREFHSFGLTRQKEIS